MFIIKWIVTLSTFSFFVLSVMELLTGVVGTIAWIGLTLSLVSLWTIKAIEENSIGIFFSSILETISGGFFLILSFIVFVVAGITVVYFINFIWINKWWFAIFIVFISLIISLKDKDKDKDINKRKIDAATRGIKTGLILAAIFLIVGVGLQNCSFSRGESEDEIMIYGRY